MNSTEDRLGPPARALIEESGLSLQELARISSVGWTTLSRWRRKENAPTAESALKLATACRARALRLLDVASALEAAARREEAEGA